VEKESEVRLRRRIEELVRSRVGLLEQDISRLQREVNESFTRLLERTDSVAVVPESDETVAQISAEINAQVGQASTESVRLGADIALLRDSVADLDEQRTQAEVLNTLVARAANFAPRIILFVVKGSNVLAWAARGFDDSTGNNAVRGLTISLQSDTALRAAINSQQTFYGSPDQQSENDIIFARFGNLQPQRVLAVALKVRGKAAAVLYADSSDHGQESINVEAIELLVHAAGLVVELVSLRARMSAGGPAAQPAAATGTSGPLTSASTAPRPQPVASNEPQAQPANSGDLRPPAPGSPTYFKPTAEPQAAPPAARSAEAPQPPQAPQPPLPPQAPPVSVSQSGQRAAPTEEEKQHNDARRFARLLVSEIKLYNEQKVADGRRNNDLYDRLKEDIDRSRQMYEKRVSQTVSAKFDYFYDELVNTLAEGDPAKLGSDYPGPSVSV
jgi:hypothetical protein